MIVKVIGDSCTVRLARFWYHHLTIKVVLVFMVDASSLHYLEGLADKETDLPEQHGLKPHLIAHY